MLSKYPTSRSSYLDTELCKAVLLFGWVLSMHGILTVTKSPTCNTFNFVLKVVFTIILLAFKKYSLSAL